MNRSFARSEGTAVLEVWVTDWGPRSMSLTALRLHSIATPSSVFVSLPAYCLALSDCQHKDTTRKAEHFQV